MHPQLRYVHVSRLRYRRTRKRIVPTEVDIEKFQRVHEDDRLKIWDTDAQAFVTVPIHPPLLGLKKNGLVNIKGRLLGADDDSDDGSGVRIRAANGESAIPYEFQIFGNAMDGIPHRVLWWLEVSSYRPWH